MNKNENTYLNTFNVLAEWIQHLSVLDPWTYSRKDARKTVNLPDNFCEEITSFFEKHPCLMDGKNLVIQGIPENTVSEIRSWPYYRNFMYMLEFLVRMTRVLRVDTIIKYAVAVKQKGGFEALNNNVEKTGIQILPKVKSINDSLTPAADGNDDSEGKMGETKVTGQKHWATERLAGINEELSGIYYIEVKNLNVNGVPFLVRHHIVEEPFFLENKKNIVIGVCPISQGDFLDTDYETRVEFGTERNYFKVLGMKNEKLVKERITAAILKACEKDVDILVFPEMLGNREITEQTFIESVADMALEKGFPMPALILLPTWWHDYSNELYVVDGSGECVCVQQKQYPFVWPDEETGRSYEEDLRFDKRVVHMVHVPRLGRLSFPICRDYLEPEYLRRLSEVLRSTFLFCPSYSDHKIQFALSAPGEIKYGCYTVWSNTCAANSGKGQCPDYVGLVSGPMANGEYIKHLKPDCDGVCGTQTDACLFVIQISMDHSAKISYEHIPG